MAVTTEIKSQKIKYRNASRMIRHEVDNQWYEQGAIGTHYGFVNAYRDASSYSIYFIWKGIEYEQHSQHESISELALIRRASQLVDQVVRARLIDQT